MADAAEALEAQEQFMPNPAADALDSAEGPYPGLRAFGPNQAHLFFGREAHTDRLLEILAQRRFLAVIGPSGCGKSSLVRAGLLPALPLGAIGTGHQWRCAEFRPGSRPLSRLAAALLAPGALGPELSATPGATTERDLAHVEAELRRGPRGLVDLLADTRRAAFDPDFNLLVLVDQFEEIFTYAGASAEAGDDAEALVNLLLWARTQADSRVFVVITMRTDFLGDCVGFLDLPDAINRGQFLTPRLNREQLASAIVGPAQQFGTEVQAQLVAELCNAADSTQDELPVLQHALARMWRRAIALRGASPVLTLDDLQQVGGIAGALPQHAEELFAALQPIERGLCEWLLRGITEQRAAEAGGQRVRRPRSLRTLAMWAGRPDPAEFEPVLRAFGSADAGFLTYRGQPGAPADGPATVVDIVHEALIRRWERLQDWTDAEARAAQQFARLHERALQVQDGQASLLDGLDLQRALQWEVDGLVCLFDRPGTDAQEAPRAPDQNWAARYAPRGEGDAAFARVQHLLQGSRRARRRHRAERWALMGVLPAILIGGALVYSRLSGGMADVEARELHSLVRLPIETSADQRDRALILVATAPAGVRQRLLDRVLTESAPAGTPANLEALMRAAVGLDQALQRHASSALARAHASHPATWTRLKVALPSLADAAPTSTELLAAFQWPADAAADYAPLARQVTSLVAAASPPELLALGRQIRQALAKAKMRDLEAAQEALMQAWVDGLQARSGAAVPSSAPAAAGAKATETATATATAMLTLHRELSESTEDDPIAGSMAARLLKALFADEALPLTDLDGALSADRDRMLKSDKSLERLLRAVDDAAPRRREEIAALLAKRLRAVSASLLDADGSRLGLTPEKTPQERLTERYRQRDRERKGMNDRVQRALLEAITRMDPASAARWLKEDFPLQKTARGLATTDDDVRALLARRAGPAAMAADMPGIWTTQAFESDLAAFVKSSDDAGVQRVIARVPHLDGAQVVRLAEAWRIATLRAEDRDTLTKVREQFARQRRAAPPELRLRLLRLYVLNATASDTLHAVARRIAGLDTATLDALPGDLHAALVRQIDDAVRAGPPLPYEILALAEAVIGTKLAASVRSPSVADAMVSLRRELRSGASAGAERTEARRAAKMLPQELALDGMAVAGATPAEAVDLVWDGLQAVATARSTSDDDNEASHNALKRLIGQMTPEASRALLNRVMSQAHTLDLRMLRTAAAVLIPTLDARGINATLAGTLLPLATLPIVDTPRLLAAIAPAESKAVGERDWPFVGLPTVATRLGVAGDTRPRLDAATVTPVNAAEFSDQVAEVPDAETRNETTFDKMQATAQNNALKLYADPFDLGAMGNWLTSEHALGRALRQADRFDDAVVAARRAAEGSRRMAASRPDSNQAHRDLVVVLSDLEIAATLAKQAPLAAAVQREKAAAVDTASSRWQRSALTLVAALEVPRTKALMAGLVGDAGMELEQRAAAWTMARQAVAASGAVVDKDTLGTALDAEVEYVHQLRRLRGHGAALPLIKEGAKLADRWMALDPADQQVVLQRAENRFSLGIAWEALGRFADASAAYEAVARTASALGARGLDLSFRVDSRRARLLAYRGQPDAALAGLKDTLQRAQAALLKSKDEEDARETLAIAWQRIGEVQRRLGNAREAADAIASGLAVLKTEPKEFYVRQLQLQLNVELSLAQAEAGDTAAAAGSVERAEALVAQMESTTRGTEAVTRFERMRLACVRARMALAAEDGGAAEQELRRAEDQRDAVAKLLPGEFLVTHEVDRVRRLRDTALRAAAGRVAQRS